MLRYAITDRRLFPGDERERCDAVVAQARHLAIGGVDMIQLREKDLPEADLQQLASRVAEAVRSSAPTPVSSAPTKILVNGPAHIAIAARAHGVHLRSGAGPHDLANVRLAFHVAGLPAPLVSLSCHSLDEVRSAASAPFDLLLFGPVFEKRVRGDLAAPGLGLDQLRQACALTSPSRILALGGIVTEIHARQCLQAGALGIAAIRMFL